MLKVRNLQTSFRIGQILVKAVDSIDLDIRESEIFGLVGESGSGKSVTALSIMRLVAKPGEVAANEISLMGQDLINLSDDGMREIRGNKIAMIFQDPTAYLNPIMTISKQVTEPLVLHQGMNRSEARSRVLEIMELVGIPDAEQKIDQYPHQLSGGMKQRVLIAMGLACQPDILIADEPTTALDVTIQAQILDLLQELQRKMGSSVILITHDLGVVAEMCHRVAVMYSGKIMEIAETETLIASPLHPYSAALLKSLPQLGKRKKRLDVIPGSVPSAVSPPSGCRFHPRCTEAEAICKQEIPELVKFPDGRQAACHKHQR